MKLWQIKGQALRLMFADTDMQFSEQEFQDGILMENSNTREKLIRMNDSIRRAIDLFFDFYGEITKTADVLLQTDGSTYHNALALSGVTDFGRPTRIDFKYVDENVTRLVKENINFAYIENSIFVDVDYTKYLDKAHFTVYYKVKRVNLGFDADDMTFELDTLGVPENVQNMICYYVKGELYQEDEAQLAELAKNQYINYLSALKKQLTTGQKRVIKSSVFKRW